MRIPYILLLFIILIPGYVVAQDIRFRKITSNQGLSHNTVYAIAQDKSGMMWFATREGLNRYDSYNIKTYYVKDSRPGGSANRISALLSLDGSIYAGTDDGLYYYDVKTDELQKSVVLPSSQSVLCLASQGKSIFVGTTDGLYAINRGHAKRISKKGAAVTAMCPIGKGQFLLAINEAIEIIDSEGNTIKTFGESTLERMAGAAVFNITKDFEGKIWLATNRGLFNFNQESETLTKIYFAGSSSPESSTVRSVARDGKDHLFIGTEEGLFVYNLKSGEVKNYQQSFGFNPKKLNDNAIYSTFVANDGSVWIGTYFGGINYIPSESNGFTSVMPSDNASSLNGKAISQMMEDKQGRIWIGSEDGGIAILNKTRDKFTPINKDTRPFHLTTNNVHAIHDDGYGNIWVGTFLGGLHQFNTKANTTTIYRTSKNSLNALSNDQVYSIYRDRKGKLWIGTQNGLNLFNYSNKKFSLFKPGILGNKFIYDIIEDSVGNLWFCTRQNGIFRYDPSNDKLINYRANGPNPVLLSNQVISVYIDSRKNMWFGTLDGGVSYYNPTKNIFKNLTIKNGLANNNVYGILEDSDGNMWLTTNRGISKLDIKTKKFINYDSKVGLPSNQFNFRSYLKDSKGLLYFGSINGLCIFDPSAIGRAQTQFPLVFTDFQLFNKSIAPSTSSVLSKQIDAVDKISLDYDQNVFTISYAAINYTNPGSTNYKYFLKGFESKWNNVGNKISVTYTNLSPGDYEFHVRAIDGSGRLSSAERTLKITVAPPFYLTKVAYLFYFVLIILIILIYTRFVKFLQHKKLEVKLERIEKEKIKELTQHRLNFFTFISHEFKTPLTLILASIDKFLDGKSLEFKKSSELVNIKSNASILFKLIQQLMEFRKIETDHDAINLSSADLVKFVGNCVSNFDTITLKKGISLAFKSSQPNLQCFFDQDKTEKILYNLLSNAVKNTTDGSIEVVLDILDRNNDQKAINIMIKDTGNGMSPDDLENIFNPFFKSPKHKVNQQDSGLGLALVNSLVKYLDGEIKIESQLKVGTIVRLSIPVSIHLEEIGDHRLHKLKIDTYAARTQIDTTQPPLINAKNRFKLLIVEDNRELLTFLSNHFSRAYEVITATNGDIALRKIGKTPPDVIVSDVKMPKMDGIELCRKLKTNKQYNYIPFILLSDSNGEATRLDGLDVGADAYIAKPFNLKEFELLISNMINSRVKLREHVIGSATLISNNLPSNNKDQEFLSNISRVLEKGFGNPTLSVEDIAAELNTSRTSLHLNLKRVMDKNASELLNEYRLKKAAIMLGNNMPINEVAFYCGYADPNYFSRVFKKFYGDTPQNFKRKIHTE
ncbi:hybrid sensor histidine kinase/response regulator transcription factor [Pedobacter sandarakinus]|uniref:hybrid sensor histidine kinase/response regulator transcription factor n=1 Tax=Pedobacter sandarakinus TaxID=353156 RepID=UPI002248093E|nr:hybrid sensor histidine kinase/response regulator transcription factor [Pedobacter sandarakinus]MCX2575454.1 ATP-binding protein [Pedobacter sandarakinus]